MKIKEEAPIDIREVVTTVFLFRAASW